MRWYPRTLRLLRWFGRNLLLLLTVAVVAALGLLVISPWLLEWLDAQGSVSPQVQRRYFAWLERVNRILIRGVIGLWVFALGSCIASFLNVVAYRLPRGRSILGRSHCPHCWQRLSLWENMPIFGWLRGEGRCRTCRVPISARYLWVEVILGAIFLTLFVLDVGIAGVIAALQQTDAEASRQALRDLLVFAGHALVASIGFLLILFGLEQGDESPPPAPADAGPATRRDADE